MGSLGNFEASITVKDNSGNDISLVSDLNGEATLEEFLQFTKNSLINIAEFALKEEQAKGFDPKPIIITDNRIGKDPFEVSPLGKIEFVSTQIASLDIVKQIYQSILDKSRVVTGLYIEGNVIFHKNKVVAQTMAELNTWIKSEPEIKPGDEIRFVNVVPYARKLERHGITSQNVGKTVKTRSVKSRDKQQRSGERILAANGVYYLSSRIALRDFKGNVKIYFGFILGSTLGVQEFPTISKEGKELRRNYKPSPKRPKNSGPYLYPYIKLIIGQGTDQ